MTLKKEIYNVDDFMNEFDYELRGLDMQACEILFDSLESIFYDGIEIEKISDYIRFQIQFLSLDEILKSYDVDVTDEMSDDEKIEAIEEYLNYNTFYHGSYVDFITNEIVFIFDEF